MINNQFALEVEAKNIALAAMLESREYGSDPYEMIHQMVDGHILCTECDRDNGQAQLDETDFNSTSFDDFVTKLAYAILFDEACTQYGDL
jgi:hypothetical protein